MMAGGTGLLAAVAPGIESTSAGTLTDRAGMGRGEKIHPAEISRVACTR